MKKIANIIPGYDESHLRQRGYNKVAKFFEEYAIEPIHKFAYYRQGGRA